MAEISASYSQPMPVGEVFELLLLIDPHWTKHRLTHTYKLIWVGPMAHNTITYIQSQLEWLSTNLGRQFDSMRGHPFKLTSFEICTSVAQVKDLEQEGLPMVVVASGGSLDCGPARDLLLDWGADAENAIIFTDSQVCTLRGNRNAAPASSSSSVSASGQANSLVGAEAANLVPIGGDAMDLPSSSVSVAVVSHVSDKVGAVSHLSTAAQLLDKWCDAKLLGAEMEDEITVDVFVPTRSPLEGKDLLEFNASEEREESPC